MSLTGGTFEKQAAIHAWGSNISGVVLCNADVPGTVVQRFQVARKATDLGNGTWHYEYAVRNHNSERSGRALTVTFPQRHDVHQRRLQGHRLSLGRAVRHHRLEHRHDDERGLLVD